MSNQKNKKLTPQGVIESYNRLSKNARGLRLRLLKEIRDKLYEGVQDAKNN